MRACYTRAKQREADEERNSRQTHRRNTAHSAHFPALSYYSRFESPRVKYESAHSSAKQAEHLGYI